MPELTGIPSAMRHAFPLFPFFFRTPAALLGVSRLPPASIERAVPLGSPTLKRDPKDGCRSIGSGPSSWLFCRQAVAPPQTQAGLESGNEWPGKRSLRLAAPKTRGARNRQRLAAGGAGSEAAHRCSPLEKWSVHKRVMGRKGPMAWRRRPPQCTHPRSCTLSQLVEKARASA
jgi:hypothetical protein